MCYFYSIVPANFNKLVDDGFVSKKEVESLDNVFFASGFDAPLMPVITKYGTGFQFMNWGLIPAWIKNIEQAEGIRTKTLNAKAETVFEKPSYRESILRRRCLVPCSGFFEWHTRGKKKYPFHIGMTDNSVLLFAGILDEWRNPDTGELLRTYSILTTEANELMAKIHNTKRRMPVILPKEEAMQYLNTGISDGDIAKLLKPLPTDDLEAYSVRRFKPNAVSESIAADIKTYYPYPELGDLLSSKGKGFWGTLFD